MEGTLFYAEVPTAYAYIYICDCMYVCIYIYIYIHVCGCIYRLSCLAVLEAEGAVTINPVLEYQQNDSGFIS